MASRSATTSSDRPSLADRFARWGAEGRRALIPYLTAGYPTPGHTVELLRTLADAGADVIELGIPFSDPLADGPTIQRASHLAIEAGSSLRHALDALEEFRRHADTAVVLFSYLNPVLRHGVNAFLTDAVNAGAQGVLLTDLPLDADPALESRFEASPLALVRLVAPTTTHERALQIARRAQGFVYFISRAGVTGARADLPPELPEQVSALRAESGVPIAVGFGISTPAHAAAVARVADGVVVGSALMDAIEKQGADGARRFLGGLRRAMDDVSAGRS
ncbi:MAG: tryptophan synthase subunit alpha [Gemmatimonadota bacterium]